MAGKEESWINHMPEQIVQIREGTVLTQGWPHLFYFYIILMTISSWPFLLSFLFMCILNFLTSILTIWGDFIGIISYMPRVALNPFWYWVIYFQNSTYNQCSNTICWRDCLSAIFFHTFPKVDHLGLPSPLLYWFLPLHMALALYSVNSMNLRRHKFILWHADLSVVGQCGGS
jgi:hypothetical protein